MMRLRRGHFLCIFIALLLSLSMLFYPELGGEAALSASVDETTPLAEAQSQSPVLSNQTFFGGTGDEYAHGVAIRGSDLYVAGRREATGDMPALLFKYALPLSTGAEPVWNKTFGTIFGTQFRQGEGFVGVSVTQDAVYAAGWSYGHSTDNVGDKERKTALHKYTSDGEHVWFRSKLYHSYSGSERFEDVLALRESGGDVVYTTGTAEAGGWNHQFILSKWDGDGNELWTKYEFSSAYNAHSYGMALASVDGFVYVTGSYKDPDQNDQAFLLKYAPNGTKVWLQAFPHGGGGTTAGWAVTTDGEGNVYVSGATNPGPSGDYDILLLKYDSDGNLLWNQTWGGGKTEYALGLSVGGNRTYVAGVTDSFGAGGYDVVLLEVDAADGQVLSSVYWGDSENDGMRYYDVTSKAFYCDIAVNGSDIYIATTTASYGAGGVDFAILHYTIAVAQSSLTIRQVSPPDGATIPYTPIELRIDVTSEGTGIGGAAVSFYLDDEQVETDITDFGNGIYRGWISPTSGAHSWYATAEKTGYALATSDTMTFTFGTPPVTRLNCTLVSPSDGFVTISPIELEARVTLDGEPVEGADVYFYVDNQHDWTSTTDSDGYATNIEKGWFQPYGTHSWHAIATKEGYTPATSDMWSFTYSKEHTYVIFQDDFEDGEAGDWEISISPDALPGTAWAVELDDGNYVLSEEGHVWAEAGDFAWTDYTLEVKVKLLNRMSGVIINFRMTGAGRYLLDVSSDLKLRKEYPSGTYSYLKVTEWGLDLNARYTFKIVCVGNSIGVYVDDVLRLDYVDDEDPHLSGRIGLEGFEKAPHETLSHVHLDDIKVSVAEHTISFSIDPSDAGYIRVDGDDYYDGDSVTFSEGGHSVEAIPYSGYELDSWDYGGGVDVSDRHSGYTAMNLRGDGWLRANFKTKVAEDEIHTYVLFEDDFEDGEAGDWETHVDSGSVWRVEREDDNYVLRGEGHCFGKAGDEEWTDYTLELKIKLIKGHVFINFRMTMKPEAPDRYSLDLTRYDLSLAKPGPRHTELKHVRVDLDPDTWYTIKIVCVENNLKIYLDDVLKIDYTDEDSPFLSGCIGFEPFFYDDDKPSYVHFDDVKVSTTHRLYVPYLIKEAEDEIGKAKMVGADTGVAEQKLAEAQAALDEGDYSKAEYLAREAIDLAKQAMGEEGPIHTSLSCQLSSHEITEGSSITVTGTINPAITKEVLIVFSYDGEEWKFGVSLGPDGRFSYTWKPPNLGEFGVEVHWPGDEIYEASDWFETFSVRSGEGPPPPTGPPIAIQYIISPAIIFILIIAAAMARRRRRPPPTVTPAPPIPPSPIEARLSKVRDALRRLERMRRQGKLSAMVYEDLRREYEAELRDLEGRLRRGR